MMRDPKAYLPYEAKAGVIDFWTTVFNLAFFGSVSLILYVIGFH